MWKIYFWLSLALTVFSLFSYADVAPLALVDIVTLIMGLGMVVAVYEYVYGRKVLPTGVYQVLWWLTILMLIESIVRIYLLPRNAWMSYPPFLRSNMPLEVGDEIFGWIFSLPGLYALYQLSQKNRTVVKAASNKTVKTKKRK